jgi:hypothetical protein
MFKIIFTVIFIILLNHFATSARVLNYEPYHRHKSISCQSSNKSVSGYKCYIKAYSQKNTTLNVFANLTKPIFYAKFSYDLTLRSISNSYRSIINVTFEVCSVLNGTVGNPVFQWIKESFPNFKQALHACPYKVSWVSRGVSIRFHEEV